MQHWFSRTVLGAGKKLTRSLPAVLALCGCVGIVEKSQDSGAGPNRRGRASGSGTETVEQRNAAFKCDPDARPKPASLRRLTMTQYRNTTRDLIRWATQSEAITDDVVTALAPSLEALPKDRRESVPEDIHGSFRRLDQSLQQIHADTLYEFGGAIGAALAAPARIGAVVGNCATDAASDNDESCVSEFIRRFGGRALRRPLSDDDVAFYKSVYGPSATIDPAAFADVIAVMLNSPEFLYFVEHGEAEVSGQSGVFELSAHELAARLSYQLWQTAPDDELTAAAADGSLLNRDTLQAQVSRLIHDPRAKATLSEFFGDWLKLEEVPALEAKNADPVFKAFAGENLPSKTLRQDMLDEVLSLFDHYVWTEPSGIGSLLTSEISFTKSPELSKLYGIAPWDGSSAPPSFPAGQRPGFLTRAWFLASGSANTRPIMRGVLLRQHILCDEVPPPPPGVSGTPPVIEPGMTTRESVEALTEKPNTACAACHAGFINPLGFTLESFDSLGRFRSEQQLFDAEGNSAGSKPVNTAAEPQVLQGDTTRAEGPGDLMRLMAESGKVEACLSRQFFRFTYARWDDEERDGCALESLRHTLASGGTIQDLIIASVLSPEFRRRAFE